MMVVNSGVDVSPVEDTKSVSSDDEIRDMKCSDLDMPLFQSKYVTLLFNECLNLAFPSRESWAFVMDGRQHVSIEVNSVLLFIGMEIVNQVSSAVFQVVAPQVISHSGLRCKSRNYRFVTEEDILASFNTDFHLGLETALGLAVEYSYIIDKMLELVATEVSNTVNEWLELMEQQETEPQLCLMHPREMVRLFAFMLVLAAPKHPDPCDGQATLKQCESCDSQVVPKHPEQCNSQESAGCDSRLNSSEFSDYDDMMLVQRDRSFITVFCTYLVVHILDSNTSIYDMDLLDIIVRLGEKTVGKLAPTLPKNVKKVELAVYKKLCLEYGSTKSLRDAMFEDSYFEETLAWILKEELRKPQPVSFRKRMTRFFNKRTSKVSPE